MNNFSLTSLQRFIRREKAFASYFHCNCMRHRNNKQTIKKETCSPQAGDSRHGDAGGATEEVSVLRFRSQHFLVGVLVLGKNVNSGGAWKQIHLQHHEALMTCRRSFVTHFQLQYECFMSSSGTFAGTVTLTVVFLILCGERMTAPPLALRPTLPTRP